MKKIKIIPILIAFIGLASSCNDSFLDRFPQDKPADDSFFKNQEQLKMATTGIYNTLYVNFDYSVPVPMIMDFATDLGWYRANTHFTRIGNGSHDSQNNVAKTWWKNYYVAIARCNTMLENMHNAIDNCDATEYVRMKSEARFFRAYNYLMLVDNFGDVPLITSAASLEDSKKPRTPKQTVVDFVLRELEECALDLPDNPQTDGRINKDAAYAMLSRAALYFGNYAKSIEAAQTVMTRAKYKLHNSYPDLFNYKQNGNKETIFEITSAVGLRETQQATAFGSRLMGASSIYVPSQAIVDSYECTDGKAIDQSSRYVVSKPYENRDPRLGYTIALPGSTYFGFQFETHRDSSKCWNYNVTPATRVDNVDGTHAYASYTGYCLRKWTDPIDRADIKKSTIKFCILRYAEVLLNYAEAKIESGDIDVSVYNAINDIRTRPTVNMPVLSGLTSEELRAAVRRERKYELAFEGHRLSDIRRWHIAEIVMPGTLYGRVKASGTKGHTLNAPKIDEFASPSYENVTNKDELHIVEVRSFNKKRDYLWPIPYDETVTNPNLLPNNPNY